MKKTRATHTQPDFDGWFYLEPTATKLPPPKQPAARWRMFADAALRRLLKGAGVTIERAPMRQVAEEIVAHGDGPAFLKGARRGRGTGRQNIRVALLLEVERMIDVERRRPVANLKPQQTAELFAE